MSWRAITDSGTAPTRPVIGSLSASAMRSTDSTRLTAANTFSGAIMGVATNYSYLMLETTWYIKDYRRCLDLVKKQREEDGKTHIGVPANAKIEFRDVSFKYPDTDNACTIRITAAAGTYLAGAS